MLRGGDRIKNHAPVARVVMRALVVELPLALLPSGQLLGAIHGVGRGSRFGLHFCIPPPRRDSSSTPARLEEIHLDLPRFTAAAARQSVSPGQLPRRAALP